MPATEPKVGATAGRSTDNRTEILSDLVDEDLLDLKENERLWKLFCFRAPDGAGTLRHRIYVKRKADGRLGLVTFVVWSLQDDGNATAEQTARTARSGIARAPDLSCAELDRIISAMRRQAAGQIYEELDLSSFCSLDAQLSWLRSDIG